MSDPIKRTYLRLATPLTKHKKLKRKSKCGAKMRRIKIRPIMPGIQFRDASLMLFRINNTLDRIRVVFFVPDPSGRTRYGKAGAFIEFRFCAVLAFKYETNLSGENYFPIEVSDIYLLDDTERSCWQRRMELLERPDESGYSLKSKSGYTEVLHVVIESGVFLGRDTLKKLQNIDLFCRKIVAKDVTQTKRWSAAKRHYPHRIPAQEGVNRSMRSGGSQHF